MLTCMLNRSNTPPYILGTHIVLTVIGLTSAGHRRSEAEREDWAMARKKPRKSLEWAAAAAAAQSIIEKELIFQATALIA